MTYYKAYALLTTIAVLFCFWGCENGIDANEAVNEIDPSAVYAVLSGDEYDRYNETIGNARPSFENFKLYTFASYPNEALKIYEIGIEGLPVLITKTNEFADEMLNIGGYDETKYGTVSEWQEKKKSAIDAARYEEFLTDCAYTMLRTDTIDINSVIGRHRHDCLNLLLYESKTDCSRIINGKWKTEEKLIELRRFGLLAIPYVVEEIEKGNSEYEEYFTLIGLHMSTYDFAEYMYGDVASIDRLEGYKLIQNDARARNFDYRVWLEKNEEALNKLYTFVDLYTACYSPQEDIRYSEFNIGNNSY